MLQASSLTFCQCSASPENIVVCSQAYAHAPGTLPSIAIMHAVDSLLCIWTDTQESMLIAGATFTDLGAANHGNCSEVDFQESYSIHVGSTVAMMQVSPRSAQLL